ncbi:SepM family pheromone-processing serine protease [Bacillus swezeyi]|uniref:endopeptidase La n=1 Tax=Bacillus swezeyi TaxID=1925020 RepID=A0A5M8S0M8_9BACI|nr:SepM family pheromone-processing serine protease [Bacillus swezeyi]KAA6453609.1 PDZ domain-containing protein [Bacillus swezeyi]KAA6476683.1 PDZ domain-containing protein [Bacillus swezeyi]TYS38348.1 PDZ domain-containing protein [Bacillus swezeyi]
MQKRRFIRILLLIIIIGAALSFVKLPYYITEPGEATELNPLIKVDNGYSEKGSFSLMTVKVGPANPLTYMWAKVRPYHEILPEYNFKQEGESDQEYMKRQLQMMRDSQENAMIAAYKRAGKEVTYSFDGVYAMSVVPGMPAEGKIEAGDKIKKADGKTFQSAESLVRYIESKKAGHTVKIVIERDKKEKTYDMKLKPFKDDPTRAGLGVSLITDRDVKVKPEVKMDIENIGGPSAGLMMSMEIYNQLTKEDETKGHHIAGTGTIDDEGKVGPIGGISQKIVAADQAGADIFFAPNEGGKKGSNYEEAVETAKDIKTDMKIVPVDTMDDAIEYLEEKAKNT